MGSQLATCTFSLRRWGQQHGWWRRSWLGVEQPTQRVRQQRGHVLRRVSALTEHHAVRVARVVQCRRHGRVCVRERAVLRVRVVLAVGQVDHDRFPHGVSDQPGQVVALRRGGRIEWPINNAWKVTETGGNTWVYGCPSYIERERCRAVNRVWAAPPRMFSYAPTHDKTFPKASGRNQPAQNAPIPPSLPPARMMQRPGRWWAV
eukprot:SAG22_NODE_1406_length_4490_cov_5.574357_4_plen_204_part_00